MTKAEKYLYIFLHIGRTGGTTLRWHIEKNIPSHNRVSLYTDALNILQGNKTKYSRRDYKLIVGLPYLFEESDGWWFNNTHELPQDNKLHNNYLFNIKNDPYERVLLDHRENKLLIIKMKRMIRSYIEDQYMEPQKNLINIQALPSRHDGVWYPFEE